MAPQKLDALLAHVGPSRRAFLRRAMAGAAFATPLLSSFSMSGLSFGRAMGAVCSNQNFTTSNMACKPKGLGDCGSYVSNMYAGATRFSARLTGKGGRARGAADIQLDVSRGQLVVRLEVMRTNAMSGASAVRIVRVSDGWILDFAAQNKTQYVWIRNAEFSSKGTPPCNLEGLMTAMSANDTTLRVTTTFGDLTGPIVPA